MASDISFDIVSRVDRQEVDNALNQAAKEVGSRFDFKDTGASIRWSGDDVTMEANGEERVKAIWDVFQSKLVKRGVSLKALKATDPKLSGKTWRMVASLRNGIAQDGAKVIVKLIKDEGPKTVKTAILGDELRVSSKSRDDLQAVQRLVRGAEADLDFAVQFVNYR
ncbi:MAG: YajQ family cyclic di-GMP-binding protein [Actinomycetia bacterium]|nr:YajQ family cyclic di-GMP-binding protein [Actinomycetes bacterium]